jgi:hypothetical protein
MKRTTIIPLILSFALFLLLSLILDMAGPIRPSLAASLLTTWHVNAATGSDSNDCLSVATPCLTVAEAAGRADHGDTIQIAPGSYQESLDLSLMLNLVGAGPDETFLDGGDAQRILTASSSQLTLAELTIRHGRVTNENGAGIYNFGSLTLQNVQVISNTAVNGGGGGIFNSGTLSLQNSLISGNDVDGAGGGLYTWYGSSFTATNSLINHNEASQGGGLYNLGTGHLADSTIRDNFAAVFGGGVTIFGGQVTLDRVTVAGNQSDGYGAGVVNNLGMLTLTNSTLSGNSANDYSALANISSSAQTTITNSTIAHNLVTGPGIRYGGIANINDALISLHNSIVADNDGRNCLAGNSWTSLGHNLASDSFCNLTAAGDLPATPASLAPLANYGGPTLTHALLPGSAAVDNGDNGNCPASDQRGVTRPVDGNNDGPAVCDIGAFEARNQLLISDVSLLEGNSGTVTAVFTVTLSPVSSQTVMVDFATADGTAVAGSDYVAASDTVIFNPGQSTQFISVLVNGDNDDEPDETFSLTLSNATNADVIDGLAVATIIDDDGLSSLAIADATTDEGNSGSSSALFVVSLSPAPASTVTVEFTTVDGTAVAGSDYEATSGTLTFTPGQTSQTIPVTIYGDLVDEGASESFTLQLSNATNANLSDDTAAGIINDDDTARVSLDVGPMVQEGNSGTRTADFTVSLDTPTAFPVTVDFYTSSGTGGNFATPGVDFQPISGTLHFAAGETEQIVSVLIYGDTAEEDDEVFSLYLINAAPISILASASLGHILNDDGLPQTSVYLPFIIR